MRSILVVDDHPLVREGIARVLTSAVPDVSVAGAQGAAELRERVRTQRYDLVILDLSLGRDDGVMTLQWLRESNPAVPVLVFSMHAPQEFAARTARAGAAGYLSKDTPPHELVRAVTTVLGGERYVPREAIPAEDPPPPHQSLSDREYQVLRMIGRGRKVSEIAAELSISVKTVSTYRSRILDKMNMRTSAELMHYVITQRLAP